MTARSRTLAVASLAFTAAAFAAACGALTKNNRCDMRPKIDQCTDWRGTNIGSEVTERGVCAALGAAGGGTFTADATCEITNMWGGCQADFSDGSKQTNWYYKGGKITTLEEAKAKCDSNMKWVDPQ